MNTRRIGLLGGTFDPIHMGHLAIAEEARCTLDLAKVLLIPAAQQPLKASHGATPDQRLHMVRLACASNPALEASDIELKRPAPSYTIDTLRYVRATYPDITDLWFILGTDAVNDLPRWNSATEIIRLAYLAVIGRPGTLPKLDELDMRLPGLRERVRLIEGPSLEISSSEIRRRIATGKPIRYLVPDGVRTFIEQMGLYADDPFQR